MHTFAIEVIISAKKKSENDIAYICQRSIKKLLES